jgi:hypothetical protein
MAELGRPVSDCCSSEQQATCCEPEDKGGCCEAEDKRGCCEAEDKRGCCEAEDRAAAARPTPTSCGRDLTAILVRALSLG